MSFLKSLYLSRRLYAVLIGVAVLFVAGYFAPVLATVARAALLAVGVLAALDLVLLFRTPAGVRARRDTPERLSNGDPNPLRLYLENSYPFAARLAVLDELPVQFQARDAAHRLMLPSGAQKTLEYVVRPTRRGEYVFGALNVYAASPLGLAERRFRFDEGRMVPVYPSFLQMRRYELLAASDRLEEAGVKKQRRLGHTMEFDHIRAYVAGDDRRTVNWKATARRGALMVNQYRDERAQPVYCVLDAGRVMKLPFDGLTLLDHSINAALVLANIALSKHDRAGLLTFSHEVGRVVPAERRSGQIRTIQEALYNVETDFLESSYEKLLAAVRRTCRQRGLLLLFTNFETRSGAERRLPYLRALARRHMVVAIFFENTALRGLLDARPETTEGIYVKALAEQFAAEKREVVALLRQCGIESVLTPPQDLSVRTINKYLELKARGVI